ncbi:MAG: amidohydrolase [Candidatus Aminicenantes bacterium]|nr:amidohydrolase [Candidatus Aminicenantes bacterium]
MLQHRMFGILLASILAAIPACRKTPPADLVLRGGKIATVDASFSFQEAVAVLGDRIVFVGRMRDAARFIGPKTKVLDLEGKLVLPGLIDAHGHMYSLASELSHLNITGTGSYRDIIDAVAEKAKTSKPGEWILGGRWDQNDWEDKAFPVHDPLSAVSPDHPVYLKRIDGNAAFANRRALELAGITGTTPDPAGGVIHRKKGGDPSGVLINRAMDLVEAVIPKDSAEQYERKILKAVEHCVSAGLTGWHEAGVTPDEIAVYKSLIDRQALKIRVNAMLGNERDPEPKGDLAAYFRDNRTENYGNHFLAVRTIKLFFDGALGSRGAAFYEPYADDPGNQGLLRITPDDIYRVAKAALETGMQVATHCIGIRGNRLCLQAYENALRENPRKDHRFRIEHAQFVEPEDVRKFAELGVIPSMQPTHCTSDMSFVEARVGPVRAGRGYAWRDFLKAGLIIPCGSDFPVESVNPLLGIYAAVTRRDTSGRPEGGWHPEQTMTIAEAVKGFTIDAAYAAFQEDLLGSIEVGKLADFTILDRDILTADPKDIPSARVLSTIVGGRVVYKRKEEKETD